MADDDKAIPSLSANPQFDALRSALYHSERASFLDFLDKSLNSLVIILSATAFSNIMVYFPEGSSHFVEITVTIFATLQLVFGFGPASLRHEFLKRKYYELLAEIEAATETKVESEILHSRWTARLISLAGEEPITMRALDAICWNRALFALTSDQEVINNNKKHISYFQYVSRNLIAFPRTQFVTRSSRQSNS